MATEDLDVWVARRAATAYASVVRDTEMFAVRLGDEPSTQDLAEYAALIAREEAHRAARRDAFATLGLTVDSVES